MPRPADMPQLLTLGERVKWWRVRRGMTREELLGRVRALGQKMPSSSLSDLENESRARSSYSGVLARALAVSPEYLATGRGDPEPESIAHKQQPAPWPLEGAISQSQYDDLDPLERSFMHERIRSAHLEIEANRRKPTRSKRRAG